MLQILKNASTAHSAVRSRNTVMNSPKDLHGRSENVDGLPLCLLGVKSKQACQKIRVLALVQSEPG
jgi:hypothetical protein